MLCTFRIELQNTEKVKYLHSFDFISLYLNNKYISGIIIGVLTRTNIKLLLMRISDKRYAPRVIRFRVHIIISFHSNAELHGKIHKNPRWYLDLCHNVDINNNICASFSLKLCQWPLVSGSFMGVFDAWEASVKLLTAIVWSTPHFPNLPRNRVLCPCSSGRGS